MGGIEGMNSDLARHISEENARCKANEDKGSVMINLGQYLSPGQLEQASKAVQEAYDKGYKAGYQSASRGALHIIGILCKRNLGNIIEISDAEIATYEGMIEKNYVAGERKTYFIWKEDE